MSVCHQHDDPPLLPIAAITQIYARRWDSELAFKTIKRHLHLHVLWSAKTWVILQQVWAVLIIAHILQVLQMEIAYRAGVDPFAVSLALLVQYLPEFAYTGRDARFFGHRRGHGSLRWHRTWRYTRRFRRSQS